MVTLAALFAMIVVVQLKFEPSASTKSADISALFVRLVELPGIEPGGPGSEADSDTSPAPRPFLSTRLPQHIEKMLNYSLLRYTNCMALIELSGVTKHYKIGDTDTTVLRDVNLAIEEGEFAAIMGPSGSGKSTLMHILGLLDSPSGGTYTLDGDRMDGRSDRQLARLRRDSIGFVFQSFNLLTRLSVLQNVVLPMVYAGVPVRQRKAKAMKLLETVGVADRAGYGTNQISGGQTQRVAIARALANEPRLILADEPTGNLDTASSDAVIALLQRLHSEGNTIVIVTHNPEIAAKTQRIIEIRDGQIVRDAHRTPTKKKVVT